MLRDHRDLQSVSGQLMDGNRKQWLHSMGVCVNCKTVDAYVMAGRWLCAECAEKDRKRQKAWRDAHRDELRAKQKLLAEQRIADGKCRRCGAAAYNGTTFCKKHLYEQRIRKQKCDAQNKEAAYEKCLWCDSQAVDGKKFCPVCLERKREILNGNRGKPSERHPWKRDAKLVLQKNLK